MRVPAKPFDSYKWRWATTTPTEGLNEPSVYLGVLRALHECEGLRPTDERLLKLLQRVQTETGTSVDLVRTPARNLLRNSQQYWKALGLLESSPPITLTPLGNAVASGALSVGDFAAAVVRTLSLPNLSIENDATVEEWRRSSLEIKPLELVLSVIRRLEAVLGAEQAFLEPQELTRIVIPLAGDHGTLDEYVQAIASRRRYDQFPVWPNCCPESNDERMAREFLLFLWHYGYCRRDPGDGRLSERYILADENMVEVEALLDLPLTTEPLHRVAEMVRSAGDIAIPAERRRVTREVTERPGQARFRRDVLSAYGGRCALTGETVETVLEACHIQPANEGGPDHPANGICLRADLHKLFDAGYILIDMSGRVLLSKEILESATYSALPDSVQLAFEETAEYLTWRQRYSG